MVGAMDMLKDLHKKTGDREVAGCMFPIYFGSTRWTGKCQSDISAGSRSELITEYRSDSQLRCALNHPSGICYTIRGWPP